VLLAVDIDGRTNGTAGVPAVATVMAWAPGGSMAPCSMSTRSQLKPARAKIWTT
jgi:hypothetical protein